MSQPSKQLVLQELNVGRRIAEEEIEQLAAYFVETDQWRRIFSGEVDVVYGPKGSGKSAIYATLLNRKDDLFDRSILVESAENPQGAPAFAGLVADPPTSEREFIGLWKLYVLGLLLRVLDEYGITNAAAEELRSYLVAEGLAPEPKKKLRSILSDALDYVRRMIKAESVEGTLQFDPTTGAPSGITARIKLAEPSKEERDQGFVSLDHLMELGDEALLQAGFDLWIVLDRLDVAFAESIDLERNALRALFKVYLDLVPFTHYRLKIFLRTDIWEDITEAGFREASHITRTLTISWSQDALLNLIIRRLLQNEKLVGHYDVVTEEILGEGPKQEELFYRIFPDQVDTGRNPKTFGWMLIRTRDGTGSNAPRELIHLLSSARDEQLKEMEIGGSDPPEANLFSRSALRAALPDVSRVRLESTLYAELKGYLQALEGEKTHHTLRTLAIIWRVEEAEAAAIAARLSDVGFFEVAGPNESPTFRVPFLYRPALSLVQGTAE